MTNSMKTNYIQKLSLIMILLTSFLISGCAQNTKQDNKQKTMPEMRKDPIEYKVTFIELGSVRCIPCQKMQPIMKSIEEKYGSQVKVVFHDVWTPKGKPYGDKYNIRAIPTQVFLDKNGVEFFRHEGFFPEDELVKILQTKGVN